MIIKSNFFRTTLFLFAIVFLYYSACRFSFMIPISMKKAQLSTTTQSLISHFTEPLQFTLFSLDNDTHRDVALLVEQYQRLNKKISYNWQRENYRFSEKHTNEALVANYQGQQLFIDLSKDKVNEASISNLLFKFKRHANAWIVFLQGHGEPELFGKQSRDYNLWRKALENQGFNIQSLTLSQTPIIADNTGLLIIASTQSEWLPQEEQLIHTYLDNGGQLLWLIDPSSKRICFLEKYFNVTPLPGTIVDSHGQQLGTPHPAITLVERYPTLPFSAPSLLSAYPWSVALSYQASPWTVAPLLETDEATWTETGPLTGSIQFQAEKGEVAGPLLLGLSLTRPHPLFANEEQRIAIIGNSRFLSNGIVENYGNLAFGQNLVTWLSHDDALLKLEQPVSSDSFSHIHLLTAYLIQYAIPATGVLLILLASLYGLKRNRVGPTFSSSDPH